MNAKKILFGILAVGILFGASCTTDNDGDLYSSSIDRDKVVKSPPGNTRAIDRDKVVKSPPGNTRQAIDRDKVVKGPNKPKN